MRKYLSLTLRLWKLLKDFHKHFYIQLFLTIAQQLFGIAMTYIAAKMLDALITKNEHLILWLIISWFIIGFIKNRILGYATDMHAIRYVNNSIQQFLEEYSFKKIFALNPSQYHEGHSAIKLQVINRGENAVETIVSTILLTILPVFTQVLFCVIAIALYSKTIAIWCSITVCIVIYWSNKFANFHRPFLKKNIENWDEQRKIRSEVFQHLTLVKLLAAEYSYVKKYLKNRYSILEHRILTVSLSYKHGNNRIAFILASRSISTAILFYIALHGKITIGAVYAVWSYLGDAYGNIQQITQAIKNLPLNFTELEKYLEIIDAKPLFNERGKKDITDFKTVTFKHVSFKYPHGEQNIFEDISFTIEGGKTTAFVGESGSGKSTITKLLTRQYDYTGGSITIDNNELRDIDAHVLRSHIGYVEQHVELFDDTIKDNILLGVEDKEKKEAERNLEEIAKLSRIDQFYHRLGEKKFDTFVGERGIKLSGGERQRVGIARAIIKNPSILIFDEATSSLDTENEKYVMDAIADVSRGKTTILIAHRLSTVKNADTIIVMDKGAIVGSGTHDSLLATNEIYQNLVAHQM